MSKTTHKERMAVAFQYDGHYKLEAALKLLDNLYQEIYSLREKEVGQYEFELTGATIVTVNELLYSAVAELHYLTGDFYFPGGEMRALEAQELVEMHKVEELHKKLSDRLRHSRNEAQEKSLRAEMERISQLPDTEAITALEAILAQ